MYRTRHVVTAACIGLIMFLPTSVFAAKKKVSVVKNCKQDISCFAKAALKCAPTKMYRKSTLNASGLVIKTEGPTELRGIKDGVCIYYSQMDKASVRLGDALVKQLKAKGKTTQEIRAQEKFLDTDLKKSVLNYARTCKFPDRKLLARLLQDEVKGTIRGSSQCDRKGKEPFPCTGLGTWKAVECTEVRVKK